ncbi:MAG: FG-GAP repeat protein, partial [Thermoplasmata archaeon]|nr:FG-GAP repeat protein [Thermoplasmata archaeon]
TRGTVDFYARTDSDGLCIIGIYNIGVSNFGTWWLGWDDNYIQYRDTTGWNNIMPNIANTWYWIQLHYDNSVYQYDIYINDSAGKLVLMVNDVNYASNNVPNQLWIDTGNAQGGQAETPLAYIDEVRICTYPSSPGTYESASTTTSGYITSVTPTWNSTVPAGTNLSVAISRDGGTIWSPTLTNGTKYTFAGEPNGDDLKYKVTFESDGYYPSIFYDIQIDYEYLRPGLILTGNASGDKFGFSVHYAGDINGDHAPDLVVGAPYNDSASGSVTNCGAVYVFCGGSSFDSTEEYVNYGEYANDHFGWAVSFAGDINNDNANETLVGAPHYDTQASETPPSATDVGKAYCFCIPEFQTLAIPIIAILVISLQLVRFSKLKPKNGSRGNKDGGRRR